MNLKKIVLLLATCSVLAAHSTSNYATKQCLTRRLARLEYSDKDRTINAPLILAVYEWHKYTTANLEAIKPLTMQEKLSLCLIDPVINKCCEDYIQRKNNGTVGGVTFDRITEEIKNSYQLLPFYRAFEIGAPYAVSLFRKRETKNFDPDVQSAVTLFNRCFMAGNLYSALIHAKAAKIDLKTIASKLPEKLTATSFYTFLKNIYHDVDNDFNALRLRLLIRTIKKKYDNKKTAFDGILKLLPNQPLVTDGNQSLNKYFMLLNSHLGTIERTGKPSHEIPLNIPIDWNHSNVLIAKQEMALHQKNVTELYTICKNIAPESYILKLLLQLQNACNVPNLNIAQESESHTESSEQAALNRIILDDIKHDLREFHSLGATLIAFCPNFFVPCNNVSSKK